MIHWYSDQRRFQDADLGLSSVPAAEAAAPAAGSLIYCSRLHFRSHFLWNPFLSGWEDKCSPGLQRREGVASGSEAGYHIPSVRSSTGVGGGGIKSRAPFNEIAEHLWHRLEDCGNGAGVGQTASRLHSSSAPAEGWSRSVILQTGGGRGSGAPAATRAPRGLLQPRPHPTPLVPYRFPRAAPRS